MHGAVALGHTHTHTHFDGRDGMLGVSCEWWVCEAHTHARTHYTHAQPVAHGAGVQVHGAVALGHIHTHTLTDVVTWVLGVTGGWVTNMFLLQHPLLHAHTHTRTHTHIHTQVRTMTFCTSADIRSFSW